MTVGAFDRDLFLRFRAAKGEVRRILLGRLIVENDPLTIQLVGQLLGRAKRKPGMRVARCPGTDFMGRIPGHEQLDWEDALQTGRIGMSKAFESLDLNKGKLSYHALRSIHYELQCLMARTAVVKVERGQEGNVLGVSESAYADEDGGTEGFQALTHEYSVEEQGEPWSHGDLAVARVDTARDREDAVESFLEERLVFGRSHRSAKRSVFGSFEAHALRRGGSLAIGALTRALEARGVRETRVRVSWAPWPVPGLAGVLLQNASPQS